MEREAKARCIGKELMGKPGGESFEIGMLKYFAQRMRSVLIHLSLSVQRQIKFGMDASEDV